MIGNGNLLRNTYRPRSDGDHQTLREDNPEGVSAYWSKRNLQRYLYHL